MHFFFTPEDAKSGDLIPFYDADNEQFVNYYLKLWNPGAPNEADKLRWIQITTEDHRNFEEKPINIHGGTGTVVEQDGKYHLFYCTFDKNPPAQWVRHAVSDDLTHWEDIPEDRFGPDGDIYKMTDWRDPFVFWNENAKQWWMLVAARENANTERNGCVGLCVSDDLTHWDYREPLYSPHSHHAANECADLFQMGDWYYLVYSNYCDGFGTYYRMSRSPEGPWIRPAIDTFDGRAFYAGKTVSDGENRYIYGWNPTRGENKWNFDPTEDYGKDYTCWNWGGSIVVHKLVQHEDGTLGVEPIDSLKEQKGTKVTPDFEPLDGEWKVEEGTAEISTDSYAAVLTGKLPKQGIVRAKISYEGNPVRFGMALQVDESFSTGYYLMFQPNQQRIEFRSGLRSSERGGQLFPYATEMERPVPLEPGKTYDLDLYIDDSIGLLYINNDIAFGFRMYNEQERSLGWFVENGTLKVWDVEIVTVEDSQTRETAGS